jgi:hypothetical protein
MVAVQGTAAGDDFSFYRLQIGRGLNPRTWLQLGDDHAAPVVDGLLGEWNTRDQDGLYALRLTVVNQNQQVQTFVVQVTVDNTPPQVQVRLPAPDQARLLPTSGVLSLYAEASDTYGLQRLIWRINGREVGESRAAPYVLLWEATRGTHTLEVIAEDLAGNRASSGEMRFVVR